MVKRSRSQSQEDPIFFNCSTMVWPYSSRHCQVLFKKPSRPSSFLSMPSSFSWLMTLTSVEMDA